MPRDIAPLYFSHGTLAPKPRLTVDEYLRLEESSEEKHEYLEGQLLDMSGGTISHSLIIANVVGELHARLKGNPCRVYDSNLHVKIPRKVIYFYPDCSVVCGPVQKDGSDFTGGSTVNPRLIVEVLSDSSERYDRGEKFTRYRELESLAEYVLISQSSPSVETFFRQGDGTWIFAAINDLKASAKLKSIGVEMPLADVYAGVEFLPTEPA